MSFTRKAKPALAITSPPVPPGNTVRDLSPPVVWSAPAAPRVQTAYEVTLLVQLLGAFWEIWRKPRTAGTATTVTIPEPGKDGSPLIQSGRTYRVRVRRWDDVDRRASPGDPDYVEAVREFTYVRDGTPAPPTNLNATPIDAKVRLTWSRVGTPDRWSIKVNGVEVRRIAGAELSTGGNNYAYDYWLAVSGEVNTFEVEAVVLTGGELLHSGGAGGANPTAQATTKPGGKWLVDPTDSTAVQIAGAEQISLELGEDGTTFTLPGRRSPVRITDNIRGLEGSVSGTLVSSADKAKFEDLKGRMAELRYIQQKLNIPVRLEEVGGPVPVSTTSDKDWWQVEFSLFQTDEFIPVVGMRDH